jgi:transcriptional regulator NrdR
MKCPFCAHLEDKVVDSRESKEGEVIRRRRECLACGKRFTSYERIDQIPHLVVKKDGRRERFDREKVLSGSSRPARSGRSREDARADRDAWSRWCRRAPTARSPPCRSASS